MKIMKKLSAFMLSLVMIVGMVPVMAVKADSNVTAAAITLGNVVWDATRQTYTFPYATANFTSDGQKIFCLSVSDGGYFIPTSAVDLGSGADLTITGISQESGSSVAADAITQGKKYSSVTVIDRSSGTNGQVTNARINKFLRSLVFYRNVTDVSKVQKVTVLGNQVLLGKNMTAMAIDGAIHYYKYVQFETTDTTSTWYTAYNDAKSDAQKFDGLRGYLATITSADEQMYLYKNIHSKNEAGEEVLGKNIQAWIGGARTVQGSMIYDTRKVTDGCLEPMDSGKDYTYWYWVCGPEAGKAFYQTLADGKYSGDIGIDNQYAGWNKGAENEPNNKTNNNEYNGKHDPYEKEYALEYGYDNEANWNDYSPYNTWRDTYGIKGYLIEYSPYKINDAAGGEDNTQTESKTTPDVKLIRADETSTQPTEEDKYYTIVLPNGTDSKTITPDLNDGDKVISITVDGNKVDLIPANGVYTVTGVTTDKAKDLVYEITDRNGNVKRYHYTISQDKGEKKDPTITDVTVKTDDNKTTPADVKIDNNGTEKTIDITVPANQTDYTFTPATKDPSSKITEVAKVSGPAEVSTSTDGKSFTAKGLDPKTPTIVKVTLTSSTGDTITYTVTIHRAEEGVTPDISVEMDGNSMNLQDLIPEDVKQNAKEILYHCCAHTVLAIDKDGTVRSIGRSNKYKSSLVHVIVKGQDDKWTDYTIYIKVNGATKKEEYGTLVDYKGLNYEITGADTCRVSSWKTNYNTKKKNIVIPDTIKANGKTYKVTAIAPGAFMRNSKIVTIKIGKNVQEIGNTSFVGLRKIKKFTISKKNKYLKVAGKSGNKAKMILSKNGKILYSMTNMQGTVTIPSSVKQITEYAGAGNVKMTKLIIPASVKRIDPCAFAHAKKMTYVQFKGKVPEMANNCVVDQMNYKKGNVYVPKKYYKQYKSAFQAASKKRYGIKQFPAMSHLKKK